MIGRAKKLCAIVLAELSIWCVARLPVGYAAQVAAQPSTRSTGVAVVELFTSQGCSSCPPADKLLADLARAAERDARPVFTLAFHVDYWNRLGWADPFSAAAYSRRQEKYAKAFNSNQIYTPQMIVNGQTQFVGSDREAAHRAIADALAAQSAATVTISVQATGSTDCRVHATIAGSEADVVVNVAVVERGLSTEVKAGENRGRRLEDPNVVRWFATVSAADARDVVVPSLPGVRRDHASVVVYVQRPGNGSILGAAAASLP